MVHHLVMIVGSRLSWPRREGGLAGMRGTFRALTQVSMLYNIKRWPSVRFFELKQRPSLWAYQGSFHFRTPHPENTRPESSFVARCILVARCCYASHASRPRAGRVGVRSCVRRDEDRSGATTEILSDLKAINCRPELASEVCLFAQVTGSVELEP